MSPRRAARGMSPRPATPTGPAPVRGPPRDAFYPYQAEYQGRLPQFPGGMPREGHDQWIRAGLPVGSPQEVIDKIMVDKTLELFATEVAPVVRKEAGA